MLSQSGRSNLQLKLINDARKLLEKVKSQDAGNISLDSSFSSFDSDQDRTIRKKASLSPSKFNDIVIVKKSDPVSSKSLSVSASASASASVSSSTPGQQDRPLTEKHEFVGNLNLSYSRSERGDEYISDIDDSDDNGGGGGECYFNNTRVAKRDLKTSRCSSSSTVPGLANVSCSSSRHSAQEDSQSFEEKEDDDDNDDDDNVPLVDLEKDVKYEEDENGDISYDASDYSRDSLFEIPSNNENLLLSSAKKLIATYSSTKSSLSTNDTQSSSRISTSDEKVEIPTTNVTVMECSSKDGKMEDSSTCQKVEKSVILPSSNACVEGRLDDDKKQVGTLASKDFYSYNSKDQFPSKKDMDTTVGSTNSNSSVIILKKKKRYAKTIAERKLDRDKSRIQVLQEENQRLKANNESLQEEMNLFDEKLACLEISLGHIKSVEKATSEFNRHHGEMGLTRSKSCSSGNSEDDGKSGNDEKSFLSAASCQTSHSIRSQGSGSYLSAESKPQTIDNCKSQDSNQSNLSSRDKAETSSITVSNEVSMLRENNEKMLYAIKALSKAIITQTRKHYHYKKKFGFTKRQIDDDNIKISQLSAEKDEVTSNFYNTRAQFLEEQDKREELSLCVQHLAKIMNDLRRKLKAEEEIKVKILDRIDEHSTSGTSLPLSIATGTSGSRRMGSIREIDKKTRDSLDEILSPKSQNSSFNLSIGTSEDTEDVDNEKTFGNLSMEMEIIKLKSKLERRDARIASLQKKLNTIKDYLKRVKEGNVKSGDA